MSHTFNVRASASKERLDKLIQERLKPGADKSKIDSRIWDLFGEDWAVMFTDLSGFSKGVAEFGIIHFLQIIYESERLFVPLIEENDGILLKIEGDSMMVIFRNVEKAIECSISMQRILVDYNKDKTDTEKILLCVGLGFGKMLRIGDQDVYGAEVNASSKLGEDIAKAWQILVTDSVKKAAKNIKDIEFEKIDEIPPGAKEAYSLKYKL
ncbi:MAG TPA: adenylate/guanylate cyclase domain-containing protein [Spirochaetota bacterium]|nr:adenylate/guanylate cyclase domain-containing protein [Spirochaetota bacterium]HQF77754.1 adenylate/guanylate cyclase domain-containing protein [Spirochaetota bacterium]HQH29518.1 adenylate/guanylate cyclase domain-containing protein [Spirochaetota bacterium]HQJ04886.1 adenylate/guanylate cyclase domain-containing protein [Spirochaetota bacterium]